MSLLSKYFAITIPEVLNPVTLAQLVSDWEKAEKEAPRVVLFLAAANAFCKGMDMDWIAQKELDFSDMETFCGFLDRVMQSSIVSIAIVNGEAIGGGVGIVSASDFVFVSDDGSFQLTEALLGLTPGIILAPLLNRLGWQKIKQMLFTAGKYSATSAIKMGLADELYQGPEQIEVLIGKLKQGKRQSFQDFKTINREVFLADTGLYQKGMMVLKQRLSDPVVKERILNIAYYNSMSL